MRGRTCIRPITSCVPSWTGVRPRPDARPGADAARTRRREFPMTEINGGEVLVRCLANEGIRFVFGLPCPEVDPLLAALERHDIRFVPVRHEAAAVHMAEGLYKTTGQVAAVLGNPGPGSANLVPRVITAVHDGVPVLVITAQHRLDIVYPSPPSTFQGQDQLDLFKVVTKWNAPVLAWA